MPGIVEGLPNCAIFIISQLETMCIPDLYEKKIMIMIVLIINR